MPGENRKFALILRLKLIEKMDTTQQAKLNDENKKTIKKVTHITDTMLTLATTQNTALKWQHDTHFIIWSHVYEMRI